MHPVQAQLPARVEEDPTLNAVVSDAAHRLGSLGRGAASIAGSADDLGRLTDKAAQVFGELKQSLNGVIAGNRKIAQRATEGVQKAEITHKTVRAALDRAGGLANAVDRVETAISDVSGALRQVADASSVINRIAFQTRIVAFNASVEAVRAGDAGRGFGVVAQAVKDLAQQVGDSSRQIATVIDELSERVKELERQVNQQSDEVDSIDAKQIVQVAIESFETNFGEVERLMRETAEISSGSQDLCDTAVGTLNTFGQEFGQSQTLIRAVQSESANLLEMSEAAILQFAKSGVETDDTPFISAAMDTAARMARCLEEVLARGEATMEDLFDERYTLINGTNPQQMMARFVPITDHYFPEFQEPILQLSPLVTFCAAVDRKGFLPTHNIKFSQPQGSDPVKNASNSRNRRLFNDRTGLRAAQSQSSFLLQTYRREMSPGVFVLMKDVSAPIRVRGKHWGAVRIGYRFAE